MTLGSFALAALWVLVLAMLVVIAVMLRQIGVLYERIAPVGALMDSAGPKVGEAVDAMQLPSLTGGIITLGPEGTATDGSVHLGQGGRAKLVFFLSPTCPVCKQLIPVLANIRDVESSWLDVVLASDGDEAKHRVFIGDAKLGGFAYALSTELGMAFRVQKLPYAVMIGGDGIIRAKGLVNNREQLESLFHALESGVNSMQQLAAVARETA